MQQSTNEFYEIASNIADRLKNLGVDINPKSVSLPFQDLNVEVKKAVIKRARLQLDQMIAIEPILEESKKLDYICHFHDLTPSDKNIYKIMNFDQPWEIFDLNFNQLYRSHHIFELGNYSVEDYESRTPFELFQRPARVFQELILSVQNISEVKGIIPLMHIKPYLLEELLTDQKDKYIIQHELVCPLEDEGGNVQGFISSFKAEKLEDSNSSNVIIF